MFILFPVHFFLITVTTLHVYVNQIFLPKITYSLHKSLNRIDGLTYISSHSLTI